MNLSLSEQQTTIVICNNNLALVGDNRLDSIPEKLQQPEEGDLFIKPNQIVDEDNYIFDLKDDEDKLLAEFEKDDEVMKTLRESQKEEIVDIKRKEKVKLENFLKAQKKKWVSSLPTLLDSLNTGLNNPNNKF